MPTFTNQATLYYNNNVTTSNVVTGELLEVLSATKTAASENYGVADTVTYIISIVNSGAAPYSNLTVTDNLGEYLFNETELVPLTYEEGTVRYYINGVLQAAPTVTNTVPLTLSGINVPAGGNAMLVYSATVNEFAPLNTDGSIVNTVTITGGGITTPIVATEIINATNEPVLTITKALSPTSVVGNGPLTYTFTISNTGNTAAVATDNVIVTDNFDPILAIQSVTLNGELLVLGTDYTYDATTGAFATVAGRITVPAATYTQDAATGIVVVEPGVTVLTVTGTV